MRECAPLVTGCADVVIVSHPLHAARARRYWLQQFPADAGRVHVVGGRRPFDQWWFATASAVYECSIAITEALHPHRASIDEIVSR